MLASAHCKRGGISMPAHQVLGGNVNRRHHELASQYLIDRASVPVKTYPELASLVIDCVHHDKLMLDAMKVFVTLQAVYPRRSSLLVYAGEFIDGVINQANGYSSRPRLDGYTWKRNKHLEGRMSGYDQTRVVKFWLASTGGCKRHNRSQTRSRTSVISLLNLSFNRG
jgi:hypothetical protein